MLRFILIRLATTIPTLLGMSFVAFAIVALAPGDPVMMELRAMGIVPKPEDIEALRARFGLDKPLLQRYFEWLARAIRFDFGSSVATGRTVISEIGIHLPATLTLAISGASLGRFVFERVRAEKSEDYVRLAIAKGLGPSRIMISHIAPRIIGPLATAWANTFGALLGGAVIVESIFGWPGLGQLILQAIAQRDFPVIQAYLVFMGLIFFATSLFADIIVVISDPQLRRRLDRE